MRLGTRWPVASPVPQSLPSVVRGAIKAVEDELQADGVDASTWRWTLTWLEDAPVVELDDGTVIRYHKLDDTATVSSGDFDDAESDE